ncbi:MAG: hypothetical protein DWI28_05905 [Planctomycetota bacterium]|nr:MAG: hypothetical protein DWI28_05905 [Planctomycetota bacterium]
MPTPFARIPRQTQPFLNPPQTVRTAKSFDLHIPSDGWSLGTIPCLNKLNTLFSVAKEKTTWPETLAGTGGTT